MASAVGEEVMEKVKDLGGGDEEAEKKKKKKKKPGGGGTGDKKPSGDDKKEAAGASKKGPSKKLIAAKLEAIRLAKEEEERLLKEEDEKERQLELAEEARREKIRLEQERKDKKKQKEKEKKERLKAEGKFLTAKQKQDKQRAQAMLEALKAQGVEVPEVGEKKTSRSGTRVRPKKSKAQLVQENVMGENIPPCEQEPDNNNKMCKETTEESKIGEDGDGLEIDLEEDEDKIKEAWDEESDEESRKRDLGSPEPTEPKSTTDSIVKTNEPHHEGSAGDSESSSVLESSDASSDEDDDDDKVDDKKTEGDKKGDRENASTRIDKRRKDNEMQSNSKSLRAPIVCVLGHVDTGKTKILDKLRKTNVQDGEAGGITQQIGATNVPIEAIKEASKFIKNFNESDLKIPGLLIIDTPGHESFSNLRSRGSSLCDIAILVVDIMHGLEPQTIESINLLKAKKTPFVVALNKIDRLYDWAATTGGRKDLQDVIKIQPKNTILEFEKRVNEVVVQFAEQGLNASLYYKNPDQKSYISMVPTSAFTGEGMGNLLGLIVELSQNMLAKRLSFSNELHATVLEVKAIPGLGTTIDLIVVNGYLKIGETIILAGTDGPIVTQIRSLLTPHPMKELRVKNTYIDCKEVQGAIGVKIAAKDLEKAIAGLNLLVAYHPDEVEICVEEVAKELKSVLSSIKLSERGVYVQASTLGSLEALLEFLRTSKIPYSGIRIGPVVKKDVMKASIMLEHDSQYAVILAFDVKIEKDAQDIADTLGVRIFQADIIYHLFDKFIAYRNEIKTKKRDEFKHIAVFPFKVKILPQFIFNSRDPIVVGVMVEAGIIKEGSPVCVPNREFLELGRVTSIEINHKAVESARKGQEVCIKIEPIPGEAPKLLGRHFEETDVLVSKISRESIDACKEYFRDDLQKNDWKLMLELKTLFQIM